MEQRRLANLSNRIPVHFDGYCPFHDLPVMVYDQCKECLKEDPYPIEHSDLPDPFDEVFGG